MELYIRKYQGRVHRLAPCLSLWCDALRFRSFVYRYASHLRQHTISPAVCLHIIAYRGTRFHSCCTDNRYRLWTMPTVFPSIAAGHSDTHCTLRGRLGWWSRIVWFAEQLRTSVLLLLKRFSGGFLGYKKPPRESEGAMHPCGWIRELIFGLSSKKNPRTRGILYNLSHISSRIQYLYAISAILSHYPLYWQTFALLWKVLHTVGALLLNPLLYEAPLYPRSRHRSRGDYRPTWYDNPRVPHEACPRPRFHRRHPPCTPRGVHRGVFYGIYTRIQLISIFLPHSIYEAHHSPDHCQ